MENQNPFKQLESDATCPANLKEELISEIDLIRNVTTVIDLYIGDLFNLAAVLVNPPQSDNSSSNTNT